jgi:hypothetical protein
MGAVAITGRGARADWGAEGSVAGDWATLWRAKIRAKKAGETRMAVGPYRKEELFLKGNRSTPEET